MARSTDPALRVRRDLPQLPARLIHQRAARRGGELIYHPPAPPWRGRWNARPGEPGKEENMGKFRILVLALVVGAVYSLPHGRARADSTGSIPPGGAPPETS